MAGAVAAVLALGGFAFYNTNVLNDYDTAKERTEATAGYERRYRRFADALQPRIDGVRLAVPEGVSKAQTVPAAGEPLRWGATVDEARVDLRLGHGSILPLMTRTRYSFARRKASTGPPARPVETKETVCASP